MKGKKRHKKQYLTFFIALSVFISFILINSLSAAVMPDYQRLEPVKAYLKAPIGVAIDSSGNIHVTDLIDDKLLIYDQAGQYTGGLLGLAEPISVAVDGAGKIYIGNRAPGNVEVYGSDLGFLYKLGSGDGEFTHPNAIAIDGAGNIYVSDGKEDEINVYNPDGSYNFSFGSTGSGDGEFNFPTSITTDDTAGEIIVTDLQKVDGHDGARVQVFGMNGVFRRSFGEFGVGDGKLFRPMGVEVDEEGRMYVSDSFQDVVQVFDGNGAFLGTLYDLDNPLRTPLGIVFGESNRLFIVSQNAGRVDVYRMGLAAPDVSVSPLSYDFGEVNVGSSAEGTITVTNEGTADLVIDAVTSPSSPFSKLADGDNCSGQTLTPSEACTINIRFEPASAISYAGDFNIPSNDPDENPITVGLSGTGAISNGTPTADPGGPYSGVEGEAIILDGSNSTDMDGSIVSYEWDIDNDGTYDYSSSTPTQSHTYPEEGLYTISLRVTDNAGGTGEALTTADISDSLPTADFTGAPTNGAAPLTVAFSDNSTGYRQPLSYEWDFDNDGVTDSTDCDPAYIYIEPGTYTVKLTVTDSAGGTRSLTRTNYILAGSSGCSNPPVRIAGTSSYFWTIQSAVNAAVDGDTILSQATGFIEDIYLNRNISLALVGGYDCDYVDNLGVTTVNGSMIFNDGMLSIENIVLE